MKNALRSCYVTTYLLQFHYNSAANCVFHHLASFNVSTYIKQDLNYQNTSYLLSNIQTYYIYSVHMKARSRSNFG